MIPELGQFALILAFALALIQSTLPLIGAQKNYKPWIRLAKPLALGQCAFIFFAFFCLMSAFISNDFSVAYVAQNSNTKLPLFYKITALWSAHEGSMLLWVTVLGLWTALVAIFSKALPDSTRARVLAVLGMISVGFLLFLLSTSDPFKRLLPYFPSNGQDLNPLLQDPGLAIHPPMLYMGYVGFSVAFAFAIAALISGKLDATWARWSRPWTLIAWCFLTFGITLGSWWSYRVLGWGGWWFWDPVENASFLPWLTGTALIHSLSVTEKRGTFKSWTVLLAITAFSLSLVGTFLVRSGILTSVHAFAVDPTRGAYMLKFLMVVIGGSLLLYAWRGNAVKGHGQFQLLSRETLLLSNNVLLMVCMATVLLGTLYPLLIQALGLGKISVGPPYFNAIFIPIFMLLLFFMGLGPMCRWRDMPAKLLLKQIQFTFIVVMILALALLYLFTRHIHFYVALGLILAFWVMATSLQSVYLRIKKAGMKKLPASQYSMLVAHIGMAICVIGVTLTSAYSIERDVRMAPGQTATVGAYEFHFNTVSNLKGPNYSGIDANFSVSYLGKTLAVLNPQKRVFPISNEAISQAAIKVGVWRDLYVVIGEPIGENAWAVRLYDKPFVRWIWYGGILMMLGGLIAVTDRRYRMRGLKTNV